MHLRCTAVVFIILLLLSSVSYSEGLNNGTFVTSKSDEVIRQVNAERAKYGLQALKTDPGLTYAARQRAVEISRLFSHTRPDGTSWRTVSDAALSENIARGHRTSDKVMAAWLTSRGHRNNILKSSFTSIGVAAYSVNGIMYWVQLFGKN